MWKDTYFLIACGGSIYLISFHVSGKMIQIYAEELFSNTAYITLAFDEDSGNMWATVVTALGPIIVDDINNINMALDILQSILQNGHMIAEWGE